MMRNLDIIDKYAICELVESSRRFRGYFRAGSMLYLHELGYMRGIVAMYTFGTSLFN